LNERHYGALQGLNKAETAKKYGDEQVHIWRRSFDVAPPSIDKNSEYYPKSDRRYANLADSDIPLGESLKDTIARVLPYWHSDISKSLQEGKNVIVAAHGNSLRSLVQYLDSLSEAEILKLNIPTGVPLVYELDTDLKPIKHYYLGDQDAIAASPGFLGMADELVSFDKRLEAIFKNLLATTAIFDTVEHARTAARQVRYQVRMVTLDGTELRTGGSYAGGANRQNNSIFIKPELEQLQKEIAEEEADLRSEEASLKTLQDEMAVLAERLEAIKSQGEQARIQEQGLYLAYQQTNQQVEELETLWKLQEEELNRLSEGDWQADKEKCQERLATIASEKQNLEAEIEEIKSNKNAIQERYQNLQEQVAQARLLKSELQGQKRYEVTDIERLSKELDNLDLEQEEIQRLLQEKVDNLEKVDTDLLSQQVEEAKTQKANLQQGLIRKQFELDDIEGQLDDIASHLDQARQQNEEWIRKQTRAEAKKEKVSERLRYLQAQLTDQYQISYTEALEKAHELEDLNLAEQEVKDLEKAIRSLGPVNLDAIEQYEEVHNRLDFLNSQRDDILSAKNLLLETITEMNDEVKERFKSTFEAIRESFKVTFRQMFGGGQADLILTEGDLLTAGVEISVQPPGKKIQSLNLMSGGEKALSALALLFSIIRVKTIPFVILDEVEAALDEANVKRFGDYLNRFDKDSQFIVVTHRKGTMAAADSIYGVTMQESGVSKIVSVKLKDLEETID